MAPSINQLSTDPPNKKVSVPDWWTHILPYVVVVLSVAVLLFIPLLASAFHQLHGLEAWRSKDVNPTLENVNKTVRDIRKSAGPPGLPGVPGRAGMKGSTGAVGLKGNKGYQGMDGIKGQQGNVGPVGPSGP